MNYTQSKKQLLEVFSNNNFKIHVRNKKIHAVDYIIEECNNGNHISISFPGYKALINSKGIKYDYRVNIHKDGIKTSLSHANIIVDIFNKCKFCNINIPEFKKQLIHSATNSDFDMDNATAILHYSKIAPSPRLLNYAQKAHGNKQYNSIGNNFDLTIEELFVSIKWIVLQEDINYPMPRFEGRKMPYARYLEAIHSAEHKTHKLNEVISRALSHTRPEKWRDMDYRFLDNIK